MTHSNQKPARDILFWSGGKDSFLALRYLQDSTGDDPVLLTTFDDESSRVPHQSIPIETIRRQAMDLGLILYTVPISYPASNIEYIDALKAHLGQFPFDVQHLVFGDLHLQDIREWREEQFGAMGYDLLFPIWQIPYYELFDRLEDEVVEIRISAVMDKYSDLIKPGTLFNRRFAESLPEEIDKMGESGEFHTEIAGLR
jgi:diphthamide synthase (EF-2-diphthine--ammonia ligase)